MATASKALRSSFGQWLVARYANRLQELNDHGYLYAKLFAQFGGFDSNISSSQFWVSCFRTYPSSMPAFRLFAISDDADWDIFHRFVYIPAETAPRFLASILVELFRRLQAKSLLEEGAQTNDPFSTELLEDGGLRK